MTRILPILAVALVMMTGCSSRPTLTVSSREQHRTYQQTFTQAYATRSVDGDYDIVLVDNPIDDAKPEPAGRPLHTQPVRPLRHMVHIHVMWTPVSGARGDHPSAANAAVNWYVWGDATAQKADVMHYGGTAFVKVYAGDNDADFSISNAALKLKAARGQMTDPLGTASVDGKFSARLDSTRVKELLAQLGDEVGGPRLTRLEQQNPPVRTAAP